MWINKYHVFRHKIAFHRYLCNITECVLVKAEKKFNRAIFWSKNQTLWLSIHFTRLLSISLQPQTGFTDSMLALHIHITPKHKTTKSRVSQCKTRKGRQWIPNLCWILLLENDKLRNTEGGEESNSDVFNNFGATHIFQHSGNRSLFKTFQIHYQKWNFVYMLYLLFA